MLTPKKDISLQLLDVWKCNKYFHNPLLICFQALNWEKIAELHYFLDTPLPPWHFPLLTSSLFFNWRDSSPVNYEGAVLPLYFYFVSVVLDAEPLLVEVQAVRHAVHQHQQHAAHFLTTTK